MVKSGGWQKVWAGAGRWAGRLGRRLAEALLGLAVIGVIYLLLTMLTGGAAGLNRWLDTDFGIFGSPLYRPTTDPEVMANMLRNFYPGVVPLVIITSTILVVIVTIGLINLLAGLGRLALRAAASLAGQVTVGVSLMTIFIIWVMTILLLWAVLNIDSTIWYLIGSTALMIVNLLLGWMTGVTVTVGEVDEP